MADIKFVLDFDSARGTAAIRSFTSEMDGMGKAADNTGRSASALGSIFESVTSALGPLGTALGVAFTARAAVDGIVGIINAASDFEASFAGVRKTVDASDAEFAELATAFRELAMEIPVSVIQLNNIAEAAGQLGIQKSAILDFTRTVALLAATTNLSVDEAATSFAQLANILQVPADQFDELGSALVALGNAGASTESQIMQMALRIAGAGGQIGLSAGQVLGLASALSSVGLEAEAGGSAISRVMIEIASSVADGGAKLDDFAAVAGMSARNFKTAFQTDAAGATVSFTEGLNAVKQSGGNVFGVLEDLGLGGIQTRDALLRASGAGDLFRNSLDMQSEAIRSNTAMQEEARKKFQTFESELQVFKNTISDVAITIGSYLLPPLNSTMKAVENAIQWFKDFGTSNSAVATAVRDAWATVQDGVEPIFTRLGELFSLAVDAMRTVWNEFGPFIISEFKNTWDGVVGVLGPAWEAITGVLTGVLDNVIGLLKTFAGILTGNWSLAWDGVKQIVQGVWEAIIALVGNSAVAVVNLVETMIGHFANAANALGATGVAGALNTAKASVDGFSQSLSTLVNGHSSHTTAVEASTKSTNALTDSHKAATGAAEQHGGALTDLGKGHDETAKAAKRHRDAVEDLIDSVTGETDKNRALVDALKTLESKHVSLDLVVDKLGKRTKEYADALKLQGERIPPVVQRVGALYDAMELAEDVIKRNKSAIDNYLTSGRAMDKIAVDLAGHMRDLDPAMQKLLSDLEKAQNAQPPNSQIWRIEADKMTDIFGDARKTIEATIPITVNTTPATTAIKSAADDSRSVIGRIFDDVVKNGTDVFTSIGNALKGGALSLGRIIVEDIGGALVGPLKKAFDDFFSDLLESVGLKKFLSGLTEKLGGAIGGALGIGGSTASDAAGSAGGAGGLGGLAGSGAGGTVSMITGIVGALGSVISAIGTLRLEGTMNAVEYNTRVSSIHLGVIIDQLLWPMRGVLDGFATDQGGLIAQLNEIRDASWRTATNTQGIYDNIRGIADNGAFGASSQVDDTWKRILGVMEELLKITHDTGREMLTALHSIDEHILGLMAPLNRIAGWDAFKLPLNANAGSLDPMKYMSDGHGLILPLPKFHDGGISTREGLAIVDKDELHIPAKVWKNRSSQSAPTVVEVHNHFSGPVLGDFDKLAEVIKDKINRMVRDGHRLMASELKR